MYNFVHHIHIRRMMMMMMMMMTMMMTKTQKKMMMITALWLMHPKDCVMLAMQHYHFLSSQRSLSHRCLLYSNATFRRIL